MRARLSSKGQPVIPKVIRESLELQAGTQFQVTVGDGKIVLEPIPDSAIDVLYRKYAGADLIGKLETEHQQETRDENTVRSRMHHPISYADAFAAAAAGALGATPVSGDPELLQLESQISPKKLERRA